MKAPIPLLILLHAVVVHCLKVVSKRGSGKSCVFVLMIVLKTNGKNMLYRKRIYYLLS